MGDSKEGTGARAIVKVPEGIYCNDCDETLTEENMHPSLIRSQNWICKGCSHKRTNKWRKENPSKMRVIDRRGKLKNKYSITIPEYNDMLALQEGVCALCGKEEKRRPLSVDHCHTTGRIRGLLCSSCNLAIGLIGDDSEVAMKIARYLE